MPFATWSDFLQMGGYALYVWSAYGLTVLVLSGVLLSALRRHRRLRQELARRERRQSPPGTPPPSTVTYPATTATEAANSPDPSTEVNP
jgi:heme exporter protein D